MQDSVSPEFIGLSSERIERAYRFLAETTASGQIPGAALLVARHGVPLPPRAFGRRTLDANGPAVEPDTVFLVASVTKPVVVTAAMLLVERGLLTLDDRVCDIVPEFGNHGKEAICLRHLMTHTSGLPDMLPQNGRLRREHAPLSEFVRRVCELEGLDFTPGTNIQYQSMGIAMIGEIIERITGLALPAFLRQEIFDPLGMPDTSLGFQPDRAERIAQVNVAEEMRGTTWGWNSNYWWSFAAPWGGMFATVSDTFRFCQTFLNHGTFGGSNLLSRPTVEAMTRNQTALMPDIPPAVKLQQAWGLGWRLLGDGGWSGYFGDLATPGSYGHGGATGTVIWVDPPREMVCVLYTTEPGSSSARLLGRCSNLVAAAAL